MIIGITGRAGSGKDTIASIITNKVPDSERFSWAAPIKEFVEAVYQFPREWLHGASALREQRHPASYRVDGAPEYWAGAADRFWRLGGAFSTEWLAACGLSPASKGVGSAFVDWFDRTRREIFHDPGKFTARYLCQQLGTEFGRSAIHPDVWLNVGLQRIERSPASVKVVTDCRFDNEAAGLLSLWKRSRTPALSNTAEVWRVVRGPGHSDPAGHASERGISDGLVTRTFPNFGSLDSLRRDVHEALYLVGLTD